jgi:MFS family permease
MVAYLIMGLNSARRPSVFIAASALVSLGSASGAAANSLALSFLPHQREAGRIFGGIAVLQALGSNLTAPLLFSSTFAWAVSSPAGWVELIFLVASAIATLALVAVMLVRVPRHSEDMERGRAVGKGRGRGRGRD